MRSHPPAMHKASVSQDWRMPLEGEKSHAYLRCLRRLEISYAMFSVNLDEAFGMRRAGKNSKAYQVLSVAPALCQRLAQPLACLLRIMLEHAKHFGITPNLAPLDAQNFQNSRSQRVALFDDLLSRILFSQKSQFSHKISALAGLVDELGSSFEAAADELTSGDSLHPDRDWDLLDSVHYDLNTCLREAAVLLKSFLHSLPDPQLAAFQAALHDAPVDSCSPLATRARHLAHRRMAFLKGQ